MGTKRFTCHRGHVFSVYVHSSHQRVECPDCKRRAEDAYNSTGLALDIATAAIVISSFDSPSSSSDSFSGGGGDFGGGGASGSWD